jgi:hypothetical protein
VKRVATFIAAQYIQEKGVSRDWLSISCMANPYNQSSMAREAPAPPPFAHVGLLWQRLAISRIAPWVVVACLLANLVSIRFNTRTPLPPSTPSSMPAEPAPIAQPMQQPAQTARPVQSTKGQPILGAPGNWGRLEYRPIQIDLPDEFVFVPPANQPPVRWYFKGYTRDKAIEFLRSASMTPAHLERLQAADWKADANGVAVEPGDELILSLAPNTRAQIYALLVGFAENSRQIDPVCFQSGHVDERLKDSRLSPSSLELLKSLLYPQGKSLLLFADFEPALRRIADDQERRRFLQAVSRKATLLAGLRINADSDVDAIIGYWGVGGRKKDVAPLLNALRHEGDAKVQILCLLPPFVREHLYTYPVSNLGAPADFKQDCFWSAMNFFSDPPGCVNGDTHSIEMLNKDYFQILSPTQLGDAIFLTTQNGAPIHAAVYIADDIVFTKNGESYTQPWILMHMQDMIDTYVVRYPPSSPLKIFYYRKKSL